MANNEFFKGKSAWVTGGAGFVGSHLVDALVAAGANVSVIDNLQAGKWSNVEQHGDSIRRIEGDVRDYALLEKSVEETKPDIIFNLAANANVPASVEDPRYDFESNTGGTFSILDTLRRISSETRFVLASSAAVYGKPDYFPVAETAALQPVSPYGASKLSAEHQVNMFKGIYNISAVTARFFNTYGPRMPRYVVIDFMHKLRKDPTHLEIIGTGQQIRDLNYVADTVAGVMMIGEHGTPGEAYNVASGSSASVTELAHMLLELLELTDTKITYTGSSWKGDVDRFEGDITKLRSLGYEPRTNLRQGLQHVINWFQQLYPA